MTADRTGFDMDAGLERLHERQRILANISRLVMEPIARDTLLQRAASLVSGATGIAHVKIMEYRATEGDLLIIAGVGWKPGVVGHVAMSLDHTSPAGRALRTGAAVTVESLADSTEFAFEKLLLEHGIVALVNVPIRIDGGVWGVLEVDSTKSRHFTDDDIGFLTVCANILGLGLMRIRADNATRDSEANAARREQENRVMMRELHHRSQNNFQLITSFLSLQRRHAGQEARDRLARAMDRVQAIALAHDQLSLDRTGDLEMAAYLRALCANIDPNHADVEIVVHATPVYVTMDRAVPAGLIVNELVTNSLKHAFRGGPGKITVQFTFAEDVGEATLTVTDDGAGMGNAPPKSGLGLTLINALAGQLGGRVSTPAVPRGYSLSVTFPLLPVS